MASERPYLRSHPWLKFDLDLRPAHVEFWLLLGEARSKCEHLANAPMLPGTATELLRVYLAKGAMATTAIEGNTLTEEEVRLRLEGKLELPPSREYLGREIDNFVGAVNDSAAAIASPSFVVTPRFIQSANRRILEGLDLEAGVVAGEYRRHSVTVARYRGAPSEDLDYLVGRMCDWINELQIGRADDAVRSPRLVAGIVRAILAHLYLAWIHPFGDGNGRTARFIEFAILVSAGVPETAAHLLSNHYNQTRNEYYRQLDAASRSGGDVVPFLRYALAGFIDQLTVQLALLHQQHWQLVWRTHVDDCFPGQRSASEDRQRALVLALSDRSDPTPVHAIRELSPALAAAYAVKTAKTLARDLHHLEQMGLVSKTSEGVRARTEVVRARLPRRVE